MPKVLILGARAPVALDHARRFAHQGWQVLVADSVSCRLSGWSRAVSHCLRLAPPRTDPHGFVSDLSAAIRSHGIDLIVPTCEEVFYLARYRHMLPASVRVAVDDFDQLRVLHSKRRFQQLLAESGIASLPTTLVHTLGEAREWAGNAPLVLKPEYSRFGVHVRLYPEGIPAGAAELDDSLGWVAQHYCAGQEVCSYSVADRGRLLAHVAYHPSHRLGKSASFYFEPIEVSQIRRKVETLVRHIGFTGQIAFDWILPPDGEPMALECNPRAVSGVHLFGAGEGLPAALMGTAQTCVTPVQARPRMLGPIMATAGLMDAVLKGRLPSWRRDFGAALDVVTHPGDIKPLVGGAVDMACFAAAALAHGCSMREASTRDIEWDGEDLAAL